MADYDNTSFHLFPTDENLRKQWIIKIQRDIGPLFQIGKSTVVCEKHFTKDDYTGWNPLRRRLKRGSVPTIFDWTNQTPKRRKLERKVLSTPEKVQCSLDETAPSISEDSRDCDSPEFTAIRLDEYYRKETETLQTQLSEKTDECSKLKQRLTLERFLVSRFSKDDKLILHRILYIIMDFS